MEVQGILSQRLVPGGERGQDSEFITSWDSASLDRLKGSERQTFVQLIGRMGEESRVAQGLRTVLTSIEKLATPNTRLYIASRRTQGRVQIVGILKMGFKNLFVRMPNSSFKELHPLCCLDFYVHSSIQRGGHGKRLFNTMISMEGTPPHRIAYDRPSPKLVGFLRKHFSLSSFTPQENNFVVFHQYFDGEPQSPQRQGRRGRNPSSEGNVPAVQLLTVDTPQPNLSTASQQNKALDVPGLVPGLVHSDAGTGMSSLQQLWADSCTADSSIKRENRDRGARRRMVIDAAAPGSQRSRGGTSQAGSDASSQHSRQGYDRVETSHVSVDAGMGRRRGMTSRRWQEGRVIGGVQGGISDLQALLRPHVPTDTARDDREPSARQLGDFRDRTQCHSGRGGDDSARGKENLHPPGGHAGDMQMKSGVRGLQQMRRHGDKMRNYTDDQYSASLQQRLESRPFC